MNLRHHESRFEMKALGQAGTFCGYGSVYDVVDLGDDVMAHGCFADSLSAWKAKGLMPSLLWQHNPREPIGAYTQMSEDSKGLYVEGKLTLDVQRAKEAYALLQDKALNGLSIGFLTRDDSYDQKTGIRTIRKADLWEVSMVTFPMNEQARVDQVKAIDAIETRSDVERFLREVGVTRSEAKAVTARLWTLARREVANEQGSVAADILAALDKRVSTLRA